MKEVVGSKYRDEEDDDAPGDGLPSREPAISQGLGGLDVVEDAMAAFASALESLIKCL